jgi:drug/metabolite transporter (DMT)-like permease
MRPLYLILLLLMNFCWAAVYSAYKVMGASVPTGGIVTLRFGMAGLCLLAIWPWLPGQVPRGRHFWLTCLMGVVLFVIGQRLQVYGTVLGSAGNSSVLMAVEPLLTSIAAAIFLRERIGPRRLAGFCLGLVGVAMLHGVWRPDFHWTGLMPSLIFLSSFVCEAAYSVMGKPIIEKASVMKMVAITLLVGTGINLVIDGPSTVKVAASLSPAAWGVLIFLAVVCTAAGYSLWFLVIRDCPINVAALTVFAQSVFGALIAWLWVGEKLHLGHLLGSLTIIGGLVLGLSRQIRDAKDTQSEN